MPVLASLISPVSRIVPDSVRLLTEQTECASVVFVSGSDRILVTLYFWIGKRVTILLPIFFYQNPAESLPRLGLGGVVTPSAIDGLLYSSIRFSYTNFT